LKKYGLDPIKHMILLALSNIPERVQALLTGAVDAVDLNHPGDVIVMRNGFKVLWDPTQRSQLSVHVGRYEAQP